VIFPRCPSEKREALRELRANGAAVEAAA
jgi:hypothetical protein